jgi:hypothetical protein
VFQGLCHQSPPQAVGAHHQVFLCCLAVAAERWGVIVHAVCMLSNHYRAVVTDPFGRLPEFYGWLHEFVGKALNLVGCCARCPPSPQLPSVGSFATTSPRARALTML